MNTLGANIRAFRKAQGWTIQDLSAATELSTAFISRMERGEINPSIASIIKIAQALKIGVIDMFQESSDIAHPVKTAVGNAAAPKVVHREQRRMLVYPGLNFSEYLLTDSMRNVGIGFVLHVSEPGATSGKEFYSHQGEECVLILKGELTLWVEERELCLKEGDSLHFRSGLSHRWENRSHEVVEAIWVVVPPTY